MTQAIRSVVPLLLVFLAAVSMPLAEEVAAKLPAPAPGHAGSLITHADAELTRLVVVDAETRTILYYRVTTGGIQLEERRDLGDDQEQAPRRREPPKPATAPAKDVPGDDPPEMVRPEGCVCTGRSYSRERTGETKWGVSFLCPGTKTEVFHRYRSAIEGKWAIGSWEFDLEKPFASIRAGRGLSSLRVQMAENRDVSGWVSLNVDLNLRED